MLINGFWRSWALLLLCWSKILLISLLSEDEEDDDELLVSELLLLSELLLSELLLEELIGLIFLILTLSLSDRRRLSSGVTIPDRCCHSTYFCLKESKLAVLRFFSSLSDDDELVVDERRLLLPLIAFTRLVAFLNDLSSLASVDCTSRSTLYPLMAENAVDIGK